MSNIKATVDLIDYVTTPSGERLALLMATTEGGQAIAIEKPHRVIAPIMEQVSRGKKTIQVKHIGGGRYDLAPAVSFKVDKPQTEVAHEVMNKIESSTAIYRACYERVREQMAGMGLSGEDIRAIATTIFIETTRK